MTTQGKGTMIALKSLHENLTESISCGPFNISPLSAMEYNKEFLNSLRSLTELCKDKEMGFCVKFECSSMSQTNRNSSFGILTRASNHHIPRVVCLPWHRRFLLQSYDNAVTRARSWRSLISSSCK
ncbi:hypothetical protein O6H91_04G083600 [Diphasiastrum complanatum]|uniref:Uncharacterized protein n=1 Tax=Diphasiastrum complanatum TaxID=34168 RepID=A0ACC2DZ30_DIPCM|nr:hypothetical protein O6H91_04G083600 [Diphasiastrum complanatum]